MAEETEEEAVDPDVESGESDQEPEADPAVAAAIAAAEAGDDGEEEEEVVCEECPPCKGGAPAWMATFADMATLLMAFFVLILSFAEMNVPKYKQITGSLKGAFGVQREVPVVEPPKANSVIAKHFSPSQAKPTPVPKVRQDTTDLQKREVEPQTENKEEDFKDNADLRQIEKVLAAEIAEGQVEVKIEDQKIVVELTSPSSSGGKGDTDDGKGGSGPATEITKSQMEAMAKVMAAQADIETEVEVHKKSEASDSEAESVAQGNTEGDFSGGGGSDEEQEDQLAQVRLALAAEIGQGLVEVEKEGDEIKITLTSDEVPTFRSGYSDIQSSFKPLLDKVGVEIANQLSDNDAQVVRIEGHTDNVPVAFSERFQSNWDLSAARSGAVADYLLSNPDLQGASVTVAGFADTKPVDGCSNDDREGRACNRRIEVYIGKPK